MDTLVRGKRAIRESTIDDSLETLRETEQSNWDVDRATIDRQLADSQRRGDPSLVHANMRETVNHRPFLFRKKVRFDPGSTVLNKRFGLSGAEISELPNSKYDLRINILNMKGVPNLLDRKRFPGLTVIEKEDGGMSVQFSSILNYMRRNGVVRSIVADFSCSSFNSTVDPRASRLYRRSLGNDDNEYFGGST
jgi:hypothetical protein